QVSSIPFHGAANDHNQDEDARQDPGDHRSNPGARCAEEARDVLDSQEVHREHAAQDMNRLDGRDRLVPVPPDGEPPTEAERADSAADREQTHDGYPVLPSP